MAQEVENETSNLLTNLKSLVKTYLIHDGSGRIAAAYEAKASAKSGDPCVLTVYGYRSAGTTSVRFRKEYNAFWDPDDEGWDNGDAIVASLPSPLVDPTPA